MTEWFKTLVEKVNPDMVKTARKLELKVESKEEQQEEIKKPCSVISAKKQRKTIEWERLDISSRKFPREIPREHFMQRWAQYRTEWYGPNRSRRY